MTDAPNNPRDDTGNDAGADPGHDAGGNAVGDVDHVDEQHRKFREALERKKANANDAHATGTRNKGVGEAHNDKQVRQFRRKSGS